jgi:hypothetical protein
MHKMNYFSIIKANFPTHTGGLGYGVQCHFQQYFSYIVAVLLVEEIGVLRENQTRRKSLTTFIT